MLERGCFGGGGGDSELERVRAVIKARGPLGSGGEGALQEEGRVCVCARLLRVACTALVPV